jgi:hypothetical protein
MLRGEFPFVVRERGWVRSVLATLALLVLATPAHAQSREVTGQAGFLGEWELTATVTERVADGAKEFSGPLTLKHVGVCTPDGPEEKTGELRLRIFEPSGRLKATLLMDGAECTYTGTRASSYDGFMYCPDRRDVPLKLWIK